MSEIAKKRKRSANFTKEEESLLVDLVRKHKDVVENRKTDAVMWKEKEACWRKLADEFNSYGLQVPRTVDHLQLKYKNLKKDVRKKSAMATLERRKTGGGTNDSEALDETQLKVKEMIKLSVDGLPSLFDSDGIEEPAATYYVSEAGLLLHDEDGVQIECNNNSLSDVNDIECTAAVLDDHNPVCHGASEPGMIQSTFKDFTDSTQGANNVKRWDVVTPLLLKQKKSTPLKSTKKGYKSRSTEATSLLVNKDKLVNLQMKCMEQEVDMNEVRKRIVRLEEQKMKLEIEVLTKKLKDLEQN